MAINASLSNPANFDLRVVSICVLLLLSSGVLFPAFAQSEGLKVTVSNERKSGEVCVSSGSETLPCKYLGFGEDEEFQFAPNAVPVGGEFQVCINDDELCISKNNGPENKPEIVVLSQSEDTPEIVQREDQSSDTNQAPQEAADSSDVRGLVLSILIIGAVAAIGVGIKRLSRKNKQEERHGFPDAVKERVLKKQNHRCAHCRRLLNVVDWDHKNGKRNDNSESNCQALCPNCHAVKTRSGR
jgi:hypothetical protein